MPSSLDRLMDRNLALEAVRVTEAAALAASMLMGRGDEKAADQAAVDAMREALNSLSIDGTVVIGEGERDEAPMLYIGEKVGLGNGPAIDIALDPLEGTTITAVGGPNALAVVAMAESGGFLNAPDVYMDKIATGPGLPEGIIDLDNTPLQNLPASISISVPAVRPRACWPRLLCAVSAARCRPGCCSATTPSGLARRVGTSPTLTANTV
jgi:fructose-1,6-bisphosphatase II / sedoheptulose-1,7-bisphosphatase